MTEPAVENNKYGTKFWSVDGFLHRENGPAIENEYGKWWYVFGIEYSEEAFNARQSEEYFITTSQFLKVAEKDLNPERLLYLVIEEAIESLETKKSVESDIKIREFYTLLIEQIESKIQPKT